MLQLDGDAKSDVALSRTDQANLRWMTIQHTPSGSSPSYLRLSSSIVGHYSYAFLARLDRSGVF